MTGVVEDGKPTGRLNPDIKEKTIDVDEIFRTKNRNLHRRTPRFITRALERLIHQDEINRIIYTYPDDDAVTFSRHILEEFRVNVSVVGEENLHKAGNRFIVASNHPLGGLDGVALLDIVGRSHPDVIFPVNDILLFIPQFRKAFIPINKHGGNVSNLKNINAYFSSESPILYFPEGLCSRKKGKEIKDWNWKKAFITMAVKYQRDIIPAHFEGRNSNFFYNLSNFRKKLGIKANIEMVLLPREMFRQKGNKLKVTFAEPVSYTFFDDRHTPTEWAQLMYEFVYTLKTGKESFKTFVEQKSNQPNGANHFACK